MRNPIKIDNNYIGEDFSPYIIAEMSGNHNGDIDRAKELIKQAKQAGASAVKMQTYTADTMTIDCDKDDFQIKGGLWDGKNLYQLYEWAHTPWNWHQVLFSYANDLGITLFSSPFDETAVDFLESLNAPAYKIASFELVDHPLIAKVAKTKKPIILSTGMATYDEIAEAIKVAKNNGNEELIVLHCISGYPTPIAESNLSTITKLKKDFGVQVGLSDHTLGTTASVAATVLGATVIEKHFTLKRADGGPDAAFSLEPNELQQLCNTTKDAWLSLGQANYELKKAETPNLQFRRSVYVVEDIKKGDTFNEKNIRRIRPGFGLQPKYYNELLGSTATKNISKGTPMRWDLCTKKT
ncbi:MAG: pseudaminic acid synthase [Pseudoalteromonas sp.]|uniref:pseudaminic acid synthase n=1 Tax=Pseudoalteromonas sp. TaxID=53249 RepID=UPI000C8E8AD9|nr:pseudaminic acid synthase [Pseudoalteromonas sp.]MAD02039.1 pseudaminic acid synthase [Pseudoalteromonas sp.]|tara:strand:- start:13064 stop:14122 length:1059 start_codon:yes stop_codon:yes gene_type:complete